MCTAGAACLQRGAAGGIHTAEAAFLERERMLAVYTHVGLAEGPAKNYKKTITGDRKK